jgi:phosphatidylglycerophosphatase A
MRDYKVPPIPDSIWQNPWHFIAFGFGSGALPVAPGTFGTLLAIPFYLTLQAFNPLTYIIIVTLITLAGMWICEKVSREINVDDHQGMCLDEFVGFLVTMIAVPHGVGWIIMGFILFRIFDIWKPQPIRYLDEKIHGGVGAILDDVAAGIYSCLILQILARII